MDAFDEILNMAAETKAKREKRAAEPSTSIVSNPPSKSVSKPSSSLPTGIRKIVGKVTHHRPVGAARKPVLSFDQVMQVAERNSSSSPPPPPSTNSRPAAAPSRVSSSAVAAGRVVGKSRPPNSSIGKIIGRSSSSSSSSASHAGRSHVQPKIVTRRNMASADSMITLNTRKRDTRSIEEIQMDIRAAKKGRPSFDKPTAVPLARETKKIKTMSKVVEKKKPGDLDDSVVYDEEFVEGNVSDIIASIFGTRKHQSDGFDSGSDDDLRDMEATSRDIEREERQTARIGRLEDKREEERQRQLEKRKQLKRSLQ
eukprot:Partr_v1_DN28433_c2_g1_i1_m41700